MGEHEPQRPRRPQPAPLFPSWLFRLVVLTILGLWVVALVISSIAPRIFQMPPSLNSAVPVVLVFLFGGKGLTDANRDRRHNHDEDGDE